MVRNKKKVQPLRKSDSAICVTGLRGNDCAFHYREQSLHRKLNHVSTQAHVVSTSPEYWSGSEDRHKDWTGLDDIGSEWTGLVHVFRLDHKSAQSAWTKSGYF